jgi:hypothetical protein
MLKVIHRFSMKKIYISLLSLMFLHCMNAKMGELFSDKINEHDEKVVVPSAKNVSALFALYEDDDNIKEVSKEFAKSDDPVELIRAIKNEGIEKKNFPAAKKALRDEELIKGSVMSLEKAKANSQWLDRGIGFAVGFGSLAVSLALYYLFQKQPDNELCAEFMHTLNEAVKHLPQMQNGKNGCT